MHSYEAAFRDIDCGVSTYCLERAFRGGIRPSILRVANRIASRALLSRFSKRLLSDLTGQRPDVVLVLKGDRIAPETVTELRRRTGATWLNFYPDDPFSDIRSNRLAFGPATLGAYDHCFIFAQHLAERYRSAGIERVSWLPFARDPHQHAPAGSNIQAEFDLVFAGNLDVERVRWLEGAAESSRMAIFGERTLAAVPRRSPLRNVTFLPAAYGKDLSRALARGKISLNIMRAQNRYSHNMRSFESPSSGVFTLSQRTPELSKMFSENTNIAFVDSPGSVAAAVDYWLQRDDARQKIALAGFRRVEFDTYATRARAVLETAKICRPL